MPRFRYRAYDGQGALKEGDLDAISRDTALDVLHRRGYVPFDIGEDSASPPRRWWEQELFSGGAIGAGNLAVFTRELATLVKADLTVDEALRIVRLQPLMPSRLKATIGGLLDDVRAGKSLSGAMSARGVAFPEYYWRLVQSGEVSGSLGDVLDDIAVYLEETSEFRSQVFSALLYPAVLLVAAVVAVGVIMGVLLPSVVPIFEDAGVALPASIEILVKTQNAIAENWLIVCGVLLALTAGGVALLQRGSTRAVLDRWLLKVPFLGSMMASSETARLARTLATLTRNGVPLVEALRISGAVLRNRAFVAAVAECRELLQQGEGLTKPLERSGLFSELALRLMAVGEQTGQLEPMLMRIATIYEVTVRRQLTRVLTLVTPALTVLIGFAVGGLILSVMGAIMSVNELAIQ